MLPLLVIFSSSITTTTNGHLTRGPMHRPSMPGRISPSRSSSRSTWTGRRRSGRMVRPQSMPTPTAPPRTTSATTLKPGSSTMSGRINGTAIGMSSTLRTLLSVTRIITATGLTCTKAFSGSTLPLAGLVLSLATSTKWKFLLTRL